MLLDLDGPVLVVDPEGNHWVRFSVTRVPATAEKPHGLDHSLTLHGHRLRRMRTYDYRDAATLPADFWTAVDAVLRARGVIE